MAGFSFFFIQHLKCHQKWGNKLLNVLKPPCYNGCYAPDKLYKYCIHWNVWSGYARSALGMIYDKPTHFQLHGHYPLKSIALRRNRLWECKWYPVPSLRSVIPQLALLKKSQWSLSVWDYEINVTCEWNPSRTAARNHWSPCDSICENTEIIVQLDSPSLSAEASHLFSTSLKWQAGWHPPGSGCTPAVRWPRK